MRSFARNVALAATLLVCVAVPATADDIDVAYNDPACMNAADYAVMAGSRLASAVGADVAANPSCGYQACTAGVDAPQASQRAIGAGLAQAYNQFAGAGDAESAGSVADAACGCTAGGSVATAFTAAAGSRACSTAFGGGTALGGMGAAGSLFYIRAAGGGGGNPQSPN